MAPLNLPIFHELVYFLRLEVHAAADDAVFIHLEFAGHAEGHDLIAYLHRQAREVLRGTFGPLEFGVLESGVFLELAHVLLYGVDFAADGAVDALMRN